MVQEQTTPVTPEKPIGGRLQTLKKRVKKALLAKVLPLLASTPHDAKPREHRPSCCPPGGESHFGRLTGSSD